MKKICIALLLAFGSVPAYAGYDEGVRAYKDGNYSVAMSELFPLADNGHAIAQYLVGEMFFNGFGARRDHVAAANWYRRAAEHYDFAAQYNLAQMCANGQGMLPDDQQAYFWYLRAAAQGHKESISAAALIERRLSYIQRSEVHAEIAKKSTVWNRPAAIAEASTIAPPPLSPLPVQVRPQLDSSGSGFRVAPGALITNYHVVDGCKRILANGLPAEVLFSDAHSDLALLSIPQGGAAVDIRSQRTAVGENVAVAGFPLRGVLSGFNMTTGTLSSMSGIDGDTRFIQITAPVQPGNSGGPVLDSAGNLMGVVVSRLDELKMVKISGSIPQNVNFAINANVLRLFLDANGINYVTGSSAKILPPTVIAQRARAFTLLVQCWK